MNDIFNSLLIFIGTSIGHILLYHLLIGNGYKTFKTVLIYVLGFIFFIYINWPYFINNPLSSNLATINNTTLPFTSIIIYSLLSILSIMLFTSPYTGDTSPTQKILGQIRLRVGLTTKTIYDSFSESELIGNRLNYLIRIGYIEKRHGKFYILPKGQKVIYMISLYRSLLNWKSSG